MKRTAIGASAAAVAAILGLLVLTVQAASITINIPDAGVARVQAMCDARNVARPQRNFTPEKCIKQILFAAVIAHERQAAQAAAAAALQEAVDSLVSDLPQELEVMICGDGIVDNYPELGHVEECDDGNRMGGDGCSSHCLDE